MFRTLIIALLLPTIACEPSGPSEEAIQAKAQQKACGRLYEGQTKVLRDMLYKSQVKEADVKFAAKKDYVQKCIEAALSDDQMKCLDPNLADKSCEEKMKAVADKQKGLQEFLLGPMKEKAPKEEKKDDAAPAADAAPADGAAADGAAAPPAKSE